jgi:hypothetical protein
METMRRSRVMKQQPGDPNRSSGPEQPEDEVGQSNREDRLCARHLEVTGTTRMESPAC